MCCCCTNSFGQRGLGVDDKHEHVRIHALLIDPQIQIGRDVNARTRFTTHLDF